MLLFASKVYDPNIPEKEQKLCKKKIKVKQTWTLKTISSFIRNVPHGFVHNRMYVFLTSLKYNTYRITTRSHENAKRILLLSVVFLDSINFT